MSGDTVVLLEGSRKERKRTQDLVEALGYVAVCVDGISAATTVVTSRQPKVLLASLPSHQSTLNKLRDAGMGPCALVLSLPTKVESPAEVAQKMGADAF